MAMVLPAMIINDLAMSIQYNPREDIRNQRWARASFDTRETLHYIALHNIASIRTPKIDEMTEPRTPCADSLKYRTVSKTFV